MRQAFIALAASLCLALPAKAAQEARFDLVIRGLSVGTLSYSAVEDGRSYALAGVVGTSGLAGWLKTMRYEAKVRGTMSGGRYQPQRYEQSGGSKRQSREVVVWRNGVPRIELQEPPKAPRAGDPDPARQRGTLDTLTTLHMTLRDVPRDQACNVNVVMYDGSYRMRLRLSRPQPAANGGLTCAGEYIRLEGFSAEEMAERVSFPFTLHYDALGSDQLRVREVSLESLWGRGRLVRR